MASQTATRKLSDTMARRNQTSTADELTELIALMPWWAGIGIGLLSYLVLHAVAVAPVPVGRFDVGAAMWRALAYGGQYALPVICGLGALTSAIRRRRRRDLLTNVSSSKAAGVLDGMRWQQFELLVGEGFRRQGFSVAETGQSGSDGGVDLVLTKGSERFLVQCKQWKAFKVGVTVVRELYGVMAARGAAGGFVVTSGRFTDEAKAFASGRNIQLMDGPALLRFIREGGTVATDKPSPRSAEPVEQPSMRSAGPTACPVCAQAMVRRVAKRGASAGNAFWGCSSYPSCKGTRPI